MPQVLYILFGAAFTVAVSCAIGQLLLRRLNVRLYRQEQALVAFVIGSALLSGMVFALCAAGLARKGWFLGIGIAILGIAFRAGAWQAKPEGLPPLPTFWKYLFGAGFGVYSLVYFFNAMAPEISPDGAAYHLGLVSRYLREHGFARITTNIYANLSQGIEMLFLFAFAFGRHSAAALVHFAFLITLPLAMLFYARRFGFASAGACGALFVFLSPIVGVDGTSAYVDVAVACIVFVLFYLLQVWSAERQDSLLPPIGLLAGSGFAAKYTAFVAVPYALGIVAWRNWRSKKPLARPLLVVAACALILPAPWLIKNWIWLSNPVSPFGNAIFRNPHVHISFEREYAAYLRTYHLKSRWELPRDAAVEGTISGVLGPLFLLAPAALLALRKPAGRRLLFAALLFGLTYPANISPRFLISVLPFLSLAMALVFTGWKGLAPALVLAHAALSWPSVVMKYSPYGWKLAGVPALAGLRIQPEESFLLSKLPNYPAARMIERLVPPEGKVFSFSPLPEAYTSREILIGFQAASNEVLRDILLTPLLPDYPPTWRLQFRFAAASMRRIRVVQTARGEPDFWSIGEMRFYHKGRELPRAPGWRLWAQPNPWDVQMAFDNSPVTRWRSWQTLVPGMFVEVDLGQQELVDSVLLECAHDQYKIRLRLEADGKRLAGDPEQTDAAPPLNLRRMAAHELQLRGITHLLVFDFDYGADDFRTKADSWGITQLGESSGARLYKIH